MARTLEGRTIEGLCAGALAGFAAWVLIEKTGWFAALLNNVGGIKFPSHLFWLQAALGGLYGGIVAAGICLCEPRDQTGLGKRIRMLVIRSLVGYAGGAAGMMIGFWIYNAILSASNPTLPPTGGRMLLGVVARGLGWAFIGVAIGAAQGALTRSARMAWLGAVGGFMGGLAGGGFFEALEVWTSSPMLARLTGFVFVGAAIGFFLKFVPLMMKQAWMQIIRGRGVGNEFLLGKRWTSIGRSETADISLFGDGRVAPIHLLIETGPSFSLLRPAHRPNAESDLSPILVNGEVVTTDTPLTGGESIDVGDFGLKFYLKETVASARKRMQAPAPASPPAVTRRRAPASRVPKAVYSLANSDPLRPEDVGHVATSRRLADDGLTGTKLHCMHGPYFDQIFALATRDRIALGRGADCDVSLPNDKAISRNHCSILLVSGRHWVDDLKSANGTFLNNVRLKPNEPAMLRPGDKIKLGDTVLEYQ